METMEEDYIEGKDFSLYNKIKFYKSENISIRFRLKERPEYFYEGKIIELESRGYELNAIKIKLTNGELLMLYLKDISESSLHPASYNPIQYFERGYISEEKRKIVRERSNNLCELRLVDCTENFEEVDHWIPSSRGGTEDLTNLRSSCSHCNRKKSDRLWEEIPSEEKL